MDPLVVDIPYLARWILVHWLIVPRRSHASAELYQKVWDEKTGSPLALHTLNLTEGVRAELGSDFVVVHGMRYGNPSIDSAVKKLAKAGVEKIIAFPLYPQYSLAATQSSIDAVNASLKQNGLTTPLTFIPAFYQSEWYLEAVREVSAPYLKKRPYDLALFSFHGLPERQVRKTDLTKQHCLASENCCDVAVDANRNCYRHQCYVTARKLAEKLNINPLRYTVCFQSRLGRTPWIKPYTDHYYAALPQRGIKRLAVLAPSFVADCLETLEEVQIRGKKQFIEAGGEDLFLVPSLNSSEVWTKAVANFLKTTAPN